MNESLPFQNLVQLKTILGIFSARLIADSIRQCKRLSLGDVYDGRSWLQSVSSNSVLMRKEHSIDENFAPFKGSFRINLEIHKY